MSEALTSTPAAAALLGSIEAGITGNLTVETESGAVSVWIVHGDLLCAIATDDDLRTVALLRLRGVVADDVAWEAEASLRGGVPLLSVLQAHVSMTDIEATFRERFDENLCRFLAATTPPRAGLATPPRRVFVTGNAVEAVATAVERIRRAESIPSALRVLLGTEGGISVQERIILGNLVPDPISIAELVATLPMEPTLAKATLHDLIQRGNVKVHSTYDEQLEDDDTDSVPHPTKKPKSFEQWRNLNDAYVGEDELEFFTDHDQVRGTAEDGAFSSVSSDLDRVIERPEPSATPVPTYAAPVLGEEEATSKVDVASEVLVAVRAAFDEAQGPGVGLPLVQLLLDGPPPRFQPLLQKVRLRADGSIPARDVVRNLRARPATEHRLLIKDGLMDLIERALSLAAEDLPDETIDALLAEVAGYNQRLGL